MNGQPLMLDLFCGGGGAATGYARAGFEIIGIDIAPQPNYPFRFILGNALDFSDLIDLTFVSFIHASPPCQAYSSLSTGAHPDLIGPVRTLLKATGKPYLIENIVGAPLENPVKLCGSMFRLGVRRHRLFESNILLMVPQCRHDLQGDIRAYYGDHPSTLKYRNPVNKINGNKKQLYRGTMAEAPEDMGIDWMTWNELREAIPPAYTEFLGQQVIRYLSLR